MIGAVVLIGGCAAAAPEPSATSGSISPTPVVYTVGQASRGQELFLRDCAGCHAPQEFSGRLFAVRWEGRSAGDLYGYIRAAMPYDAPGRLTDGNYLDLVAYVLQLNGYPSGAQELSAEPDKTDSIRFPMGQDPLDQE